MKIQFFRKLCEERLTYQSNDDGVPATVDVLQKWLNGGLPSSRELLDVILCTLMKMNLNLILRMLYYYLHNAGPPSLIYLRYASQDSLHILEKLR